MNSSSHPPFSGQREKWRWSSMNKYTLVKILWSVSQSPAIRIIEPKKKKKQWRAFISRWQILFIETCNGNKVIIISEIRKRTQTKFDMVPKMAKATRPFWLWLCYKQNFLTNYINQGTRGQDFCNKHNRRPTRANRSDKRENWGGGVVTPSLTQKPWC